MNKPQFLDLSTVRDKVKFLLSELPDTRNNDMKLAFTFWFYEVGKEEMLEMSTLDFCAKGSNNRLTNYETIRRSRIELQKQFEHLKGEGFGKKKTNETPLFKVNIREK
jgi:membrane-bound lytic murein transglycosylase MltF